MDKKYLRFILLAMPIYIGTLWYMQWNKEQWRKAHPPPANPATTTITPGTPSGTPPGTPGFTSPEGGTEFGEPNGAIQPEIVPPNQLGQPEAEGSGSRTATAPTRRSMDLEPIVVDTQSYHIEFSAAGGVPTVWQIVDPEFLEREGSIESDSNDDGESAQDPDHSETAQMGGPIDLIDRDLEPHGLDRPLEIVLRERSARFYRELSNAIYSVKRITESDGTQVVEFTSPTTESGLRMIRTYELPPNGGKFMSRLRLKFINEGTSRLEFDDLGQGLGVALGPGLGYPPEGAGGIGAGRYAYTTSVFRDSEGIQDLRLNKPKSEDEIFVPATGTVPWAALNNRYFMMALIPDDPEANEEGFGPGGFQAGRVRLDLGLVNASISTMDDVRFYPRAVLYGAPFSIEPGQSAEFGYRIFAGPKSREILKAGGLGLEGILFHDSWSWMRALCLILMTMLTWFHGVLGNWGVAIIILVIVVRGSTLPLSQLGMKQQAKVMAEQAKLKPYMDKINEKHKNNSAKRSEEMMKLYKEHNVNPLGMFKGCIFMFIQLPIFFALYRLLSQSIDLRGAEFLWITDLSEPDQLFPLGFTVPLLGVEHFNLLPILTAVTQLIVGKLTQKPAGGGGDPTQAAMQKQMMYMMPVMILFMTYSFPSGLVLYWFVSNVWQLFQQRVVNKMVLGPDGTGGAGAPAKA